MADYTNAVRARLALGQALPDDYLERARVLAASGGEHTLEALRGLEEGIAQLGPIVSLELYAIDLELMAGREEAALARVARDQRAPARHRRTRATLDLETRVQEGLARRDVLPAWLGIRFGEVPAPVRKAHDLTPGASSVMAVYPDSPAEEAELQAGDVILGPPDARFDAPRQIREWTMLTAVDQPAPLAVLRGDGGSR